MKKLFILTVALLAGLTLLPNRAAAQDEVYANENAPANYDANLQTGGKAIGIAGESGFKRFSNVELNKKLAGKEAGVSIGPGDLFES